MKRVLIFILVLSLLFSLVLPASAAVTTGAALSLGEIASLLLAGYGSYVATDAAKEAAGASLNDFMTANLAADDYNIWLTAAKAGFIATVSAAATTADAIKGWVTDITSDSTILSPPFSPSNTTLASSYVTLRGDYGDRSVFNHDFYIVPSSEPVYLDYFLYSVGTYSFSFAAVFYSKSPFKYCANNSAYSKSDSSIYNSIYYCIPKTATISKDERFDSLDLLYPSFETTLDGVSFYGSKVGIASSASVLSHPVLPGVFSQYGYGGVSIPDINIGEIATDDKDLNLTAEELLAALLAGTISWEEYLAQVGKDAATITITDAQGIAKTYALTDVGVGAEVIAKPSAPAISTPGAYQIDLSKFFPFCIPFDLYNMFACFLAAPAAPQFEWPIPLPRGGAYMLNIDLAAFDGVAQLVRGMELVSFCIFLALKTRDLIKG